MSSEHLKPSTTLSFRTVALAAVRNLLHSVIPNRRRPVRNLLFVPYKNISHNPMPWACAKTTFSRERLQSADADLGEPGFPLGYTYAWVELQ
jgi:hypothetical protein